MMEGEVLPPKAKLAMSSEELLLVLRYGGAGGLTLGGNVTDGGQRALEQHPRWDPSVANITITVFASFIIFCTLAGNALVIVAVIKERRLRKVSNSFVINLAVSDILVGCLVTPIALAYQLHGQWIFSQGLCDFWVSVDVTCCTASITNLCAISYDRYNAITEPLRYARKRTLKWACLLILIVWLYSVLIAVPPFFGWRTAEHGLDTRECKISQDIGYTFYSTIGAFYLPLLFMIFAYICIYRETSKRTRQWKRGPGSSKLISERDSEQEAYNIRMMQLAGETQPLAPKAKAKDPLPSPPRTVTVPPAAGGSIGGAGGGLRRGSGSGVFLRNSSLVVRHSIPYESAIVEVDENTRKEGSSSSGSSNNATPSTFMTTVIAHTSPSDLSHNGDSNGGGGVSQDPDSATDGGRPVRRSHGQFPRKLIRQISNLPSSDSSTATSSSSANTTSSSDLPTDQSPYERRYSSVLVRQNTLSSFGDRKESLVRALQETAMGGGLGGVGGLVERRKSRAHEGTPRKSVTFLTPAQPSTPEGSSTEKNPSPTNHSDYNVVGLLGQELKSNGEGLGKSGGGKNGGHNNHHKYNHHNNHRHLKRRKRISVSQEKRAAKTLSIIMGCFIICWLPFFLVALIEPLCSHCHFHPTLIGIVMWMGYCNSALNPIIYTFFNKDFRFAFKKILHCTPRYRSTAL